MSRPKKRVLCRGQDRQSYAVWVTPHALVLGLCFLLCGYKLISLFVFVFNVCYAVSLPYQFKVKQNAVQIHINEQPVKSVFLLVVKR